jgi:hypothetical protein
MAHSLAGVTISVDDRGLVEVSEANYTFQDVLDATSETISYYGAKSDKFSINFILDENVNSNTGRTTIKAAVKANADVNFTMDTGSLGNVRILSFRSTRLQALNKTNPVYSCAAELVEV